MERKGSSLVIVLIAIVAIWFVYSSWQKAHPASPRKMVGTESILYKDTTFVLTTKIDTVYPDPERAREAASEEARDIKSMQDR